MYAAVTTATRSRSEDMAEEAVMVGEGMVTWLREIEGFEGLLMLTDEETGAVQVVALWDSRATAERHREARGRLRDRIGATAGVEVAGTTGFDVPFAFLNR